MDGESGSALGAPPAENGATDLRRVYWTFLLLGAIGLTGALLYSVATSGTLGAAAGVLGAAALVAGAFALIGGLIGFVFAIPRSRQAEQRPQVEPTAGGTTQHRLSDYAANTNLEQISDWLTKILVGVSLIQFDQLSSGFGSAATTLAPLLGNGTTARPVTLALMAYFTVWGFFVGYLLTRLWLPKALSRAEREEEIRKREAERNAELSALERQEYNHLYEAPPGGFTRAIEAIEAYYGKQGSLQSAWLWLYLAAAYGQKHRYCDRQGHQEEAEQARNRARDAVERALSLDPGTKPILQQLYQGDDPNENDLASLRGDPRLEELLAK